MTKILVVDDEETDRILIGEMLISGGYEPIYAKNGRDALRTLDSQTGIRAVITDLRMPHLNGLRLIHHRREAGDSIPMIAISGVNADQLSMAKDVGAIATLRKPVDREALLQLLGQALDDKASGWNGAWISHHPEGRFSSE